MIKSTRTAAVAVGHPALAVLPILGSYIGVPIVLSDGTLFGTLCAVDREPRTLAARQTALVVVYARLLAASIERDQEVAGRERAEEENRLWRAIMMTLYENPDALSQALRMLRGGGAGYDVTRSQFVAALRQLLGAEHLLDTESELMTRLHHGLAGHMRRLEGTLVERLTPREKDVLQLLAQGQTNRQIAGNLDVSAGTVKVHVEHIIAKLAVCDRTQAVVRAIEFGLLTSPSR